MLFCVVFFYCNSINILNRTFTCGKNPPNCAIIELYQIPRWRNKVKKELKNKESLEIVELAKSMTGK